MEALGTSAAAAPSHAEFRAQRQFQGLDGLRALSVLAVVWYHSGASSFEGWTRQFGAQGVTLFFAISGFLITTLLLREHDRNGRIDLRAFYIRRALRIFPLYYGVLLLYVVVVAALEPNSPQGRAFFGNLIFFATYTSNWFVALDGRVIFYFAWSLAAEEQFYAFWPPTLRWLGTRARALAFLSVLVGVFFALEIVSRLSSSEAMARLALFLANVPIAIVLGVGCALLLHERQGFDHLVPWFAATRWHSLVWLAAMVGATALPELPRTLSHLAFAGLVASCVMRTDHALAALLRWRPMAYVGSVSYGVYMLHMLAKNAVVKVAGASGLTLDPATLFAATTLVTIAAATISFRYYESYFLRLKHRHAR